MSRPCLSVGRVASPEVRPRDLNIPHRPVNGQSISTIESSQNCSRSATGVPGLDGVIYKYELHTSHIQPTHQTHISPIPTVGQTNNGRTDTVRGPPRTMWTMSVNGYSDRTPPLLDEAYIQRSERIYDLPM